MWIKDQKHVEAHLLLLKKYLARKVPFGNSESERRDLNSENKSFVICITKSCQKIIHRDLITLCSQIFKKHSNAEVAIIDLK